MNGAGFVDLAPGDTFDGLEKYLRARIAEVYENRTLGISASVGSKRNANELAKHRAPGEGEEVHKFAAKNIGALFERGLLGIRHFDKKAMPGQRWTIRFVRVFTPFVFDEERLLATITLKENGRDGNFYSVEAVDITKDARPERTPRGAMPEGLNAAPLLDLASLMEDILAYYVDDCNRTKPEFVNRTEPFSIARAAELLVPICKPSRTMLNPANAHLDASAVYDWLAQARNHGYMQTNLFPDDRKIADWLRREAAVAVNGFDDCQLLVVHEGDFDRLFFAAKSLESVAIACRTYADATKIDCVLDVVGPQPIQKDACDRFYEKGFAIRKTLTRLQRRTGTKPCETMTKATARPTTAEDAVQIHTALHQFFDARSEQLPCMEEVRELCSNGSSFVACSNNAVRSFLLGEIQGKKGTVRYWFTMPSGRGKGVGSTTMKAFFEHCKACGSTYQELWVLDDNENAIKRYEHYGFAFDRLKDTVFIKEKA